MQCDCYPQDTRPEQLLGHMCHRSHDESCKHAYWVDCSQNLVHALLPPHQYELSHWLDLGRMDQA